MSSNKSKGSSLSGKSKGGSGGLEDDMISVEVINRDLSGGGGRGGSGGASSGSGSGGAGSGSSSIPPELPWESETETDDGTDASSSVSRAKSSKSKNNSSMGGSSFSSKSAGKTSKASGIGSGAGSSFNGQSSSGNKSRQSSQSASGNRRGSLAERSSSMSKANSMSMNDGTVSVGGGSVGSEIKSIHRPSGSFSSKSTESKISSISLGSSKLGGGSKAKSGNAGQIKTSQIGSNMEITYTSQKTKTKARNVVRGIPKSGTDLVGSETSTAAASGAGAENSRNVQDAVERARARVRTWFKSKGLAPQFRCPQCDTLEDFKEPYSPFFRGPMPPQYYYHPERLKFIAFNNEMLLHELCDPCYQKFLHPLCHKLPRFQYLNGEDMPEPDYNSAAWYIATTTALQRQKHIGKTGQHPFSLERQAEDEQTPYTDFCEWPNTFFSKCFMPYQRKCNKLKKEKFVYPPPPARKYPVFFKPPRRVPRQNTRLLDTCIPRPPFTVYVKKPYHCCKGFPPIIEGLDPTWTGPKNIFRAGKIYPRKIPEDTAPVDCYCKPLGDCPPQCLFSGPIDKRSNMCNLKAVVFCPIPVPGCILEEPDIQASRSNCSAENFSNAVNNWNSQNGGSGSGTGSNPNIDTADDDNFCPCFPGECTCDLPNYGNVGEDNICPCFPGPCTCELPVSLTIPPLLSSSGGSGSGSGPVSSGVGSGNVSQSTPSGGNVQTMVIQQGQTPSGTNFQTVQGVQMSPSPKTSMTAVSGGTGSLLGGSGGPRASRPGMAMGNSNSHYSGHIMGGSSRSESNTSQVPSNSAIKYAGSGSNHQNQVIYMIPSNEYGVGGAHIQPKSFDEDLYSSVSRAYVNDSTLLENTDAEYKGPQVVPLITQNSAPAITQNYQKEQEIIPAAVISPPDTETDTSNLQQIIVSGQKTQYSNSNPNSSSQSQPSNEPNLNSN